MNEYLADVRRYDAGANEEAVDRIVKYLGIALRNRDSSLVSCSDPAELERIRDKWCMKRLGAVDPEWCDSVLQIVCETMRADRAKSRVTFYYLVAKHLGGIEGL